VFFVAFFGVGVVGVFGWVGYQSIRVTVLEENVWHGVFNPTEVALDQTYLFGQR
jgi:hypothetical protein